MGLPRLQILIFFFYVQIFPPKPSSVSLDEDKVCDEREVVRGVRVAGHTTLAELLLRGELEGRGHDHGVLGVEHVVEGLDVLAVLADLPRGVGRLLAALVGVGRVQAGGERYMRIVV